MVDVCWSPSAPGRVGGPRSLFGCGWQRHDCSRGHASIKQARTLQQVLTYENYSLISPGLVFKAYREITSSMVVISKNLSKEIHPTLMMQCATLARSPNNDKPSKLLE